MASSTKIWAGSQHSRNGICRRRLHASSLPSTGMRDAQRWYPALHQCGVSYISQTEEVVLIVYLVFNKGVLGRHACCGSNDVPR